MNKSHLSVRIDDLLLRHVKTKPNYSRYIESLIKQDMQLQSQEPIYQAITQRLLGDDEVLAQLAKKIAVASTKPITTRQDDVTLVENDWGA